MRIPKANIWLACNPEYREKQRAGFEYSAARPAPGSGHSGILKAADYNYEARARRSRNRQRQPRSSGNRRHNAELAAQAAQIRK